MIATTVESTVPKRALLLSLVSLWVPVVSSALFPDWTSEDVGVLVWLLALVPGFLLSYYRGWKGASVALAAGMAALSVALATMVVIRASLPPSEILLGLVTVLTGVSLGSGMLSTLFHRSLERTEWLALTDAGTGIPNRRHAILELEKSFSAAERGAELSVVLFDLDHFKRVNDHFGHAEGDRVLAAFAGVLHSCGRAMNVSARFGGEEFVAILRDTDAEGARVFAERVRKMCSALNPPCGTVTVSAGIAEYEAGMASPDVLVAAADQALYRAKSAGRDQVVVLADAAKPQAAQRPEGTVDQDAVPRGCGELVLVVDDDVDALRSVSRALRRFGYTVLEAPSPTKAVEIVQGLEEPIDLVLTDMVMPEMGGFRLAEILTRIQGRVRVVYMSGYFGESHVWRGAPGTVHERLSKPISIYTLARSVRRVLDLPDPPPDDSERARHDIEGLSRPPKPEPPEPDAFDQGRHSDHLVAGGRQVVVAMANGREATVVGGHLERMGLRCSGIIEEPGALLDGLSQSRTDLVVLDLGLPQALLREAFDILHLRGVSGPSVLVILARSRHQLADQYLSLVHCDYLGRPFSPAELESRARNLIRVRACQRWMESFDEQVRSRVTAQTAELAEAWDDALLRLAWAAECRDDLTGSHAERVGKLAGLIAGELGWSSPRRVLLEKAAPLHDLGKLAVPDSILRKAGDLTPAERKVIQGHAPLGARILSGSRNPTLQMAEEVAGAHHERWDGTGYPEGLAGEAIPESGRIVAVADAFDSLTNHRPYRDAVSYDEAFGLIENGSGSQFDPRAVEALRCVLASGRVEAALDAEVVARPDPENRIVLRGS